MSLPGLVVTGLALAIVLGWSLVLRREASAAAAHAGLLHATGELLEMPAEDLEPVLAQVARLAVPALGAWCSIDLRGPDGSPRRVAFAGSALPGSPAAVSAPLVARGRMLGEISVGPGRGNGARVQAVARELGRRCGLALDNARLLAEARTAERRLADSNALLTTLFDSAPVGLGYLDTELRFVRVNDRLAETNGIPAEQHRGRTPAELLPDLDGVEAEMRRVLETGVPLLEDEITGETPAAPGRRRTWLASYYPVRSGDTVLGIGVVVFEITDRRAADRALRAQTDRYETLLAALSEVGEGMVVLEDAHLVYANAAFEHLTGYGLDELRAMRSVWELIPPSHRDEARTRADRRVREGLIDPHYELVLAHRSGRLVDIDAAGVPLRVDEHDQLVVVVRDITARKRAEAQREEALLLERQARAAAEAAERRMTLLADASALFDVSLDEAETLERVARLTVGTVADTCAVLLTEGRSLREAIGVARDPRREAVMKASGAAWAAELAEPEVLASVLRTGHPVFVRRRGPEPPSGPAPEAAAATAERLGGAAVVPLRARERIFGVLGCGFEDPPAPDHEQEMLSLLTDLARRAALAMDNARLYAERTRVAQTLQRSLLPPDLPELPGASLAAAYRPAGEGAEVGGDFYDCFATSGGEWALVIGDVCGKGAEAAAITALARYTTRASTLHSHDPVEVLSELNHAILRHGTDFRFCTVLYAALRPDGAGGWRARLATGGHPLPLVLRRDGTIDQPGRPGMLLGIVPDPELSRADVALAPGDTLVLYTDGVIEASPLDDALGPEALSRLIAGQAGRSAAQLAAAIEKAVLDVQGGTLRDDIAVVVLQVASRP